MLISCKRIGLLLCIFAFSACDDKAVVTVYDKSVIKTPIHCLSLRIVPEERNIRKALELYYPFKRGCPQRLEVSYKSGIVCNSPYNAPKKTLSCFPNSYLTMEVRRGLKLQYSYYIDLDHKPGITEIEKGFERIRSDLKLSAQ